MTTVHRCDGCGEEFRDKNPLTRVGVTRNGRTVDDVDLCGTCDPDDLVCTLVESLVDGDPA